ncbi:aldo/keto reductase [Gaoshiqia sediminis]|uniref:Aldo/keto reductase n=1 Tax=Gaoshiqia sediminis TaxID=2986998 RepID=A0AA42C7F5_9BACT|nr:aldo/keto reductase [Gaoshiqia sediminis]MCW0481531.1 aldo/keto reductase [Gaoshiqia sediminis]
MKKFTRREFVKTSLAGVSAASVGYAFSGFSYLPPAEIDQVQLGKTGLLVSRLALGTGTNGHAHQSDFTRMGFDNFLKIARTAHERGVTFIDTADSYGTHHFVSRFLKEVSREKCQIMTKIWTENNSWNTVAPIPETLDRFRKELNTDYLDLVLLHCMTSGNWVETKASMREELNAAKQNGIVKTVGVSCHNFEAMKVAVEDPWVDVILARINPGQKVMDGTPEQVMDLLKTANENGKGVIGMKIFGAGQWADPRQREESIKFAIRSGNVHAMTLGMTTPEQVTDAVDRIMAVVNS